MAKPTKFEVPADVAESVVANLGDMVSDEDEARSLRTAAKGKLVSAVALLVPHMIEHGLSKPVIKAVRKVIRGKRDGKEIPSKQAGVYLSKSSEDKVCVLLSNRRFIKECENIPDLDNLQDYFATVHGCNGFNAIYARYCGETVSAVERIIQSISKLEPAELDEFFDWAQAYRDELANQQKDGIQPPDASANIKQSELNKVLQKEAA